MSVYTCRGAGKGSEAGRKSEQRASLEDQAQPKLAPSPPVHAMVKGLSGGERARRLVQFGGEPPSWTVALCGTALGALESAPYTLVITAHAGDE